MSWLETTPMQCSNKVLRSVSQSPYTLLSPSDAELSRGLVLSSMAHSPKRGECAGESVRKRIQTQCVKTEAMLLLILTLIAICLQVMSITPALITSHEFRCYAHRPWAPTFLPTNPFVVWPNFSFLRQSGQYHLVLRGGKSFRFTHSK